MSRLSGSYDLGRFTGTCAASGERLEPGSPCVTALCEASDAESANAGTPFGLFLRRFDYSLEGWKGIAGTPRAPAGLLYFWRTTVPTGEGRRSILIDDEVLLEIFHRLEVDTRPQRVAFRFVLGLYLIRRKLLRVVGQRREGEGAAERELWLVLVRGTDSSSPPIEMVNPRLRDEDISEIAGQLNEVMQGNVA
ncbi:MAG: hypothetical protein JNM94_02145 [Phycisphaerae bacterium]|nr:hypothetical protein [Phycisphaerae bacterium]